jgi:membrane protease YdiL (CAAX protease family)
MNRRGVLGEIALVYLLILFQLWFVGAALSFFVILPLAVVLVSWVVRGDTWRSLGLARFSFRGFASLWRLLAAAIAVVLIVAAFANPGFFRSGLSPVGVAFRFVSYLIPALLQQIILNGYFVNRVHTLARSRNSTVAIVGFLFCIVHLPNPVLLPLTLFGGMISAYFFLRSTNVYPLAVAHAALAAVAFCALPQAWHHGFRVGLQYYLYTPVPGAPCLPEFLKLLGL